MVLLPNITNSNIGPSPVVSKSHVFTSHRLPAKGFAQGKAAKGKFGDGGNVFVGKSSWCASEIIESSTEASICPMEVSVSGRKEARLAGSGNKLHRDRAKRLRHEPMWLYEKAMWIRDQAMLLCDQAS